MNGVWIAVRRVETCLQCWDIKLRDRDVEVAHSERIPREFRFPRFEVREELRDHPVNVFAHAYTERARGQGVSFAVREVSVCRSGQSTKGAVGAEIRVRRERRNEFAHRGGSNRSLDVVECHPQHASWFRCRDDYESSAV